MKKYCAFLLWVSCLLSGCGAGSMSSGSPNAELSAMALAFGDEVIDTASQPLTLTLTNSGTATLTIESITASANFGESNDCGSTLSSGANCTITVTFTPSATGQLQGTVSISDSATSSPQAASLNGIGVKGTTETTLTGYCWGSVGHGAPNECGIAEDTAQCPLGQQATTPTEVSGCLPPQSQLIDTSTSCKTQTQNGEPISGACLVQVTSTGGSCSVQEQQCGAAQLPSCCPGLACVPASDRAYCQPE
jgi:hypothetical protein